MKKRIFLGLVLAAVVAGGAFAAPDFKFSLGAGGYFTSDFGGGAKASSGDGKIEMPYAGGGGFVFLDATYAELSLGFWGGGGNIKMSRGGSSEKADMSYGGLDIGLLGKYPIAVSEQLSIFPLLGITYRAMLSAKEEGEKMDDPGDFSALWFKLGGGLDYSFTDHIFLRAGLFYGLRLANKFENDMVDAAGSGVKTRLGHGLEIKLAVGYSF